MGDRNKLRRFTEEERMRDNPCANEQDLSMKCLNDHGYDKSQCELYFQNYKYCLKFWSVIKTERKKEGIEPALPPPEEREEVKRKYLPRLNNL